MLRKQCELAHFNSSPMSHERLIFIFQQKPMKRQQPLATMRILKENLMKPKPYHVFLLILPIMTYVFYGHFSNEARLAQETIHAATRVSGKVTHSKYSVRTKDYWVDVTIPSTFGVTKCAGSISQDEYAALPARSYAVAVYVSPKYDIPRNCWTVSELDKVVSRTTPDNWFLILFMGIFASFFVSYSIVGIPFGPSRKSLKKRWADDA